MKNYDAAIADYNKAIELDPNNLEIYVVYGNRGIAYTRSKKYAQALYDLEKAIQMGATDGEVYYCRGLCYQALSKLAQDDFDKAKELGYDANNN